jgi:acyl-homoserine-lactone acylase
VASDPLVGAARSQGLVLLDGAASLNDWVEEDGARDPGLVPYARMPQRRETTYAFNANDSFWMTNVEAPLSGPYSPLHGRQDTAQSPRTRQNAQVLRVGSTLDLDGADDRWTLDEVTAAALDNTGYLAFALRDPVVQRCTGAAPVEVPELTAADGTVVLPAEAVDVTATCAAIAGWNGRYDLDERGPVAWREFVSQVPGAALREAGSLWDAPFDATRPVDTPAGLAEPAAGEPDQILQYLARATQVLAKAGVAPDARLGDVQLADRGDVSVRIHGGTEREGVTNKVDTNADFGTAEPLPELPPTDAPGSTLRAGTYPINNGTSWLMAVQFTPEGPDARVLLTYGPTGDRASPLFSADTARFSDKEWRTPLRSAAEVAADDPEAASISGG